jgi:hypothetical protein
MQQRQQNSTDYPLAQLMTDASDHMTGKTGLQVSVTIEKNGAGPVAAQGAVTEGANGTYWLAPNATDRNTVGLNIYHWSAAGADSQTLPVEIVPWAPFDPNLGLARLDQTVGSRALEAGGNLAAVKGKTDQLPADPASEATVASRATQASVDTKASQATANLIKGKTDNLPADPASEASVTARPLLNDIENSMILAKQEEVVRSLGLSQENFAIDNFVYTGGKATSMRLRIYSVAGSVGTDFDVIAVYNITAVYAGDNLTSYQVVKV